MITFYLVGVVVAFILLLLFNRRYEIKLEQNYFLALFSWYFVVGFIVIFTIKIFYAALNKTIKYIENKTIKYIDNRIGYGSVIIEEEIINEVTPIIEKDLGLNSYNSELNIEVNKKEKLYILKIVKDIHNAHIRKIPYKKFYEAGELYHYIKSNIPEEYL